jgi:succinyl-CoA synthetase beta subunit
MKNWTDPIINWNQLPGTEVKRLIDTWGKDEAFIAKYDKKHGYVHTTLATPTPATKTEATTPAKAVKKATTVATKKVPVKASVRQKHTGADGEIKFVEHRNLFVGFMGGKVVVTKRTEAQCREFLVAEFGAKCGEKTK